MQAKSVTLTIAFCLSATTVLAQSSDSLERQLAQAQANVCGMLGQFAEDTMLKRQAGVPREKAAAGLPTVADTRGGDTEIFVVEQMNHVVETAYSLPQVEKGAELSIAFGEAITTDCMTALSSR